MDHYYMPNEAIINIITSVRVLNNHLFIRKQDLIETFEKYIKYYSK